MKRDRELSRFIRTDQLPDRRDFADSDRESDMSDELEYTRVKHNRKLKDKRAKTTNMDRITLMNEKQKPKFCGLNFEEMVRL